MLTWNAWIIFRKWAQFIKKYRQQGKDPRVYKITWLNTWREEEEEIIEQW